MTLAEAGEVFCYWEQNPPAHLMLQTIARLIGWQPPRLSQDSAAPQPSTAALADLAAAPPPGLAVLPPGTVAMPPPIFDLATLRARNVGRARSAAQGSPD